MYSLIKSKDRLIIFSKITFALLIDFGNFFFNMVKEVEFESFCYPICSDLAISLRLQMKELTISAT
jgi:hypothetical protein